MKVKVVFTPTINYKTWLTEVAKYYEVSEEDILGGSKKRDLVSARQTFYWLCWRDKIHLAKLSLALGKDRTTVGAIMNHGWKNRQRNVENKIYEKISTKKDLTKKKRETITGEAGFCSNVEISGRLVFITAPRG